MNISIPAGGEKPKTKEPPKGKNTSITREPTQTEEMKNIISEIKNTLEGITSRLDEAEDRISELKDRVEKNMR